MSHNSPRQVLHDCESCSFSILRLCCNTLITHSWTACHLVAEPRTGFQTIPLPLPSFLLPIPVPGSPSLHHQHSHHLITYRAKNRAKEWRVGYKQAPASLFPNELNPGSNRRIYISSRVCRKPVKNKNMLQTPKRFKKNASKTSNAKHKVYGLEIKASAPLRISGPVLDKCSVRKQGFLAVVQTFDCYAYDPSSRSCSAASAPVSRGRSFLTG